MPIIDLTAPVELSDGETVQADWRVANHEYLCVMCPRSVSPSGYRAPTLGELRSVLDSMGFHVVSKRSGAS